MEPRVQGLTSQAESLTSQAWMTQLPHGREKAGEGVTSKPGTISPSGRGPAVPHSPLLTPERVGVSANRIYGASAATPGLRAELSDAERPGGVRGQRCRAQAPSLPASGSSAPGPAGTVTQPDCPAGPSCGVAPPTPPALPCGWFPALQVDPVTAEALAMPMPLPTEQQRAARLDFTPTPKPGHGGCTTSTPSSQEHLPGVLLPASAISTRLRALPCMRPLSGLWQALRAAVGGIGEEDPWHGAAQPKATRGQCSPRNATAPSKVMPGW